MFESLPSRRLRKELSSIPLFDLIDNSAFDLFDEMFSHSVMSETFKVDVKETDKAYIVEAELKGYKKEDISVELKEEVLTIEAVSSVKRDDKNEKYILKERESSKVSRSFHIDNIDDKAVTASFDEGILTLNIPKIIEKPKSNKINIL